MTTLSVVVIGRNEGGRLERCLRSVLAMERNGFALETIYVDSDSLDGSVALAERLGARVIALPAGRTTAAMGRNAGWRAAAGEVVLFLDGDTELHPRFVVDSLPELRDRVAIVWGHRREQRPESSVYVRVMDLDWVYAPGWAAFCGGDALVRREALVQAGGFDETLIAGEEPELCRRMTAQGWRIWHADRPMTTHDLGIKTLGEYVRRAQRAGYAYAEVSERFRLTADPFWDQDARRNRVRAGMLCGLGAGLLASAATWESLWPLAVLLAGFGLVATRSAWKARWKSDDWTTLLLYGVHSQLQQIPIFAGQLRFFWNRRRGLRTGLVEYKRG